jgi:hypothetical protein
VSVIVNGCIQCVFCAFRHRDGSRRRNGCGRW